jgi:hypothetical protein
MGRRAPEEEVVSRERAAQLLGVSQQAISDMVSRGVLTPVQGVSGGRVAFLLSDLSAVLEAVNGKVDLASVGHTALKALVVSRRTEKKLKKLLVLLGVEEGMELPLEESGVLELYLSAKSDNLEKSEFEAAEVFYWARVLMALTEEYLALVTKHTHDPEPWKLFLDLAQNMAESRGLEKDEGAERWSSFRYLDVARKQFRHVAYFYARQLHGARMAKDLIPDGEVDLDTEILQLIYAGG